MSRQIRILHVDDEPGFGEVVATFLEREDERFVVESLTGAADGLDRLAREGESVDCVVSDYQMPGRTGVEFLAAVREEHPDLPFILFTGKGSEEVAGEAITAGVTDYLQKGGGTEQYAILARRIANVVSAARAREEADRMATHLEQIRQHATDVIWISSADKDEMLFVSDAYGDVWGRPPESLLDEPLSFLEAVHPEDRDRVREALAEQERDPDAYEETYRVVRPDGTVRWVTDRAAGIYDDGTLAGVVGVATDITDLKGTERSLREETAFTEAALEVAVEFYWGIDLEGYVTRWSDADGSVTGYTREEAIGLHTSTFHPDDHFPRIEAAIEELKRTGSTVVRADLLTKGGERVPYEFAGSLITDDEGNPQSMCGIGRDVGDP